MVLSLGAGKQEKFGFFINEQNLVVADPRFKEIDEGFSDLQLGQASVPNHWSFPALNVQSGNLQLIAQRSENWPLRKKTYRQSNVKSEIYRHRIPTYRLKISRFDSSI